MPPAKLQIQIGMTFNHFTVLCKGAPSNAGHPRWKCRCSCGVVKTIRQSHLIALTALSCGCVGRSEQAKRLTTHGMYGTPEYRAWCGLKARCNIKTNRQYVNYGGRGIKVCDRWNDSFQNFYADMGKRPSKKHSIDRRDNDGNYEPSNCRWATKKEQANNRRTNTYLSLNGETKSLREWAEASPVDYDVFIARLSRGFTLEEAITIPKSRSQRLRKNSRLITWKGQTKCLRDWCEDLQLNYKKTHQRLFRNDWSLDDAFTP